MHAEIVNVDGLTMMAKSDTNHWVVMTPQRRAVGCSGHAHGDVSFRFGGCFCMTVNPPAEGLDVGRCR